MIACVLQGIAFAAVEESQPASYLHIEAAVDDDFYQFNERGVYVPQTEDPVQLREGWIVLSGQEPLLLVAPFGKILLQRESILGIGPNDGQKVSFYLVAGSGNFYTDQTFFGNILEVSTPVGIYKLKGPGELFVSSDYAELVFSLGGKIQVMNTITRQVLDLPPFTYLDLADPFLHEKEISRQTYLTLSINPRKAETRVLPPPSATDSLVFEIPEELFPVKEEIPEAAAPRPSAVIVEEPTPAIVQVPLEEVPIQIEAAVVVPDAAMAKEPERAVALQTSEVEIEVVTSIAEAPSPAAEQIPLQEAPIQIETVVTKPDEEPEPTVAQQEPAPLEESKEPEALPPVEHRAVDLYIVHTSDTFGLVEEGIGYSRLASLLSWGRRNTDQILLLDAGNTVSGTPLADAFAGETIAVLLDLLGYHAITPGPADYAFGLERLLEGARYARQLSDIKVLGANILDEEGNQLFEPYAVFPFDGCTVGVIGVSVPPEDIEGISYFSDVVVEQAQALVDEVASQCDFVVLLGNFASSSVITSEQIANAVSGIDLIIDGAQAGIPAGGRRVGDTLIVQAQERLSGVGVVQVHLVDQTVQSMQAARVLVQDVLDPANSALAKAYGITTVPLDITVQSYIDQQKTLLAAKQQAEAAAPQAVLPLVSEQPPVVSEEPAVVSTAEEPESPLAVQKPSGITSSLEEEQAPVFNAGFSSTVLASRIGITGGETNFGISINPFFRYNAFALGLQAYFLAPFDDILSPDAWPYTNIAFDTSSTIKAIQSSLRFIDYIHVGSAGDAFFLLADGVTPITFGNGLLVNNFSIDTEPYEKRLGLYGTGTIGRFGYELFFDDLYLSALANNLDQIGGLRFTYSIPAFGSRPLNLALSSLVRTDLNDVTLYPALDLSLSLRDERRMKIDTFFGMATVLPVTPFDFTTIYDSTGTAILEKLPNFLVSAGATIRTLNWDFRFVGAVQNNGDPIVSLGSIGPTLYLPGERMIAVTGAYFLAGTDIGYRGEHLSVSGSWHVPIEQDFSRIIPLATDSTMTADVFGIEASYRTPTLESAIGLRRVGFLSSLDTLFDFSSGIGGFAENLYAFVTEDKNAQPYFSITYHADPFSIHGKLYMDAYKGAFSPYFSVGATVSLGMGAK